MNDRRAAIKQNLEAASAPVRDLLSRITPDILDKPSVGDANPAWKVRQVANHLASSFDTLVMVGERVRKGQRVDLPAPLLNLMSWWSQFTRRSRTPEQMLAEFDEGKRKALAFIDSCSDEDLDKKAKLPILGEQTLETWLNVYGFHMAGHMATIQSLVPPAQSSGS
jgi:hypothetical protein